MENIISRYKTELLHRIDLRKIQNKTREQILIDNFKYFDLSSSSMCNLKTFMRANERIGILETSKENLFKIFNYYNSNNSGEINYRVFVKRILSFKNEMNNYLTNDENINQKFQINDNYSGARKKSKSPFDQNIYNYKKKVNTDNKQKYTEKKVDLPLDLPFFKILISHFLSKNGKTGPSKSMIFFYKDFKINQKNKLYNKISMGDFMDIITKNNIDFSFQDAKVLFNYYRSNKDGNFYYEKLFDDLLNLYWNDYREKFTVNKINELITKKITLENFYNIITIIHSNENQTIANNFFKNKLKINNANEYFEDLIQIFINIKYAVNNNKDIYIDQKDIFKLIKFISFGIKYNEDFETAINYIFNKNSNESDYYNNNNSYEDNNKYNDNYITSNYNYNTSLSSLIILRKYFANYDLKTFIKIIKMLNYYSNGNRFIKKYDFAKVLKEFYISLNVNDIEQIFDTFCDDRNKIHLNYFKFIEILINEFIGKERINVIAEIYSKINNYLNEKKIYEMDINLLKNIYNPKNNYYQVNEDQALRNFYENFYEFHYEYFIRKVNGGNINDNIVKENNFVILKEEFFEFYKMMSFIIEKDDLFYKMINNEWSNIDINTNNNLNNNEYEEENINIKKNKNNNNYEKLKSDLLNTDINTKNNNVVRNKENNLYNNYIDDMSPLEKLKQKLKLRGLRGLMNLHKQFIFTCSNLSSITIHDFVAVMKNQKINLTPQEYSQLFSNYIRNEKNNNNSHPFLNFPKFLREFKKPLNNIRLEAVEDAFSKLDVNSNDNVLIDYVRKKYNPKNDPLVLKGIKNEEEISIEFLDCFELNYNLLTALENQDATNMVTFEEFANFYEYVSFLYDDDREFAKVVELSWDN